jgi:LmbE family N-acetylglucosaminyl deacetylase
MPDKENVWVVYGTDGMGSPSPIIPWRDKISADLGQVRIKEAQLALSTLGVPAENIHFLGLPDGGLGRHRARLKSKLLALTDQINPRHTLVPFRFDRHPDHLAINHVLTKAHNANELKGQLTEYFVYFRWRFLRKGDVRLYIRPDLLLKFEPGEAAALKRAALGCFKSQTTVYYPWQTRPNLTPEILDETSHSPELFLPYDPNLPGTKIFTGSVPRIRLAHRLEPFIKKQKDQVVGMWRRGFH